MKNWLAVLAALCLLAFPTSVAQADEHDQKIYLDEDYGDERAWALGLSLGLVDIGESVIDETTPLSDDDVEQYLMLNLRIPFGDRHAHRSPGGGGFRGFIEPEIGYWDADFSTNLSVGVNLIGSMPLNAVEFFVGGGIGWHFLDTDFALPSGETSNSSLGLNAQFGVDISANDALSFFAVSRLDVIDDERDELERKLAVGLRFRF